MSGYELAEATSPWLGAVPSHWRVSRFGYEASVNGGQVDPRDEPWASMVLVAPNHIESGTGRILGRETASEQGADSGKYLARAGQILYSKIRPALNKVTIAVEDCLCSADMYAMSFRSSVVPRYALYYMLARPFNSFATVTSMRVKMPKINREELAACPWLVPPSDEQRAIANYLDRETARIDTLIEEQQRLIEMLRERRLAAVEAALSDVQTSGPRLKHIIQSVRQGWSPQCYAWSADGVEKWAVLKTGAANGGRFRPTENKELPSEASPRPDIVVRRGDLIVSRANTRDLVGSAAVVAGDFPRLMLCDKLYAFTLDEHQALPRFVATVLGSRRWRDLIELEATGASQSMLNVSQADIVNLPMPVPPVEEQRRIVTRLDEQTTKIDRLIVEAERFIELARERRSALITAAVTGQIDLRQAV
ncbi:restriction endonuclease subunit S [Yinghuangia sp. ASG 101]|uniref:restriction endonuclease subunit S n=1 Tax=Yinghuangia sp. ASG 101 TaxID=2896848 RepID=UPI001E647566|nr:restriction endonuclease subunit S [Yinghuangia sp. ASG 101]UGQ13559.1 restriction endonuclease subunit S [Yinghuangia sp. ASG 101]